MATTETPAFTIEFEDVLPIVLLPPSDDFGKTTWLQDEDSSEPDDCASEPSTPDDTPHRAPSPRVEDRSPPDDPPHRGPSPRADGRSSPDDGMKSSPRKTAPPETPSHKHPIPSMQDAFNESLVESKQGVNKPRLREHDAKGRRERLLAQDKDDDVPGMRWRYRPGQEQHELCKLMSQIAFGMHLLLRGMANSDDQVVTIIQGHIDEVDEFLEVALEDLQLASSDLSERIRHLRLPLEHIEVFEKILEDRSYRADLLRNNEIIEHVLSRTAVMLGRYEKDTTEGLRSTKAFSNYLGDEGHGEALEGRPEVAEIYEAMKGNTNGWHNALLELDEEVQKLNGLITELTVMVGEMQAKAGEVSRRTWNMIEPFSVPGVGKSNPTSPSFTSNKSPESNSIRESVSTVKAPSQRQLTIRTQLAPAQEDPFDDPRPVNDGDSGTWSQADAVNETDDLYILQPKTYTPRLPAPLPSPMVKDDAPSRPTTSAATSAPASTPALPSNPGIPKRSSLRQRVSPKGILPESIQIPPPNIYGAHARPRTSSPKVQCPPDSAYGSDVERNRPGTAEPSPTLPRANRAMPSPRSDFQAYYPVQASPYSPLQQRPHTSHNTVRSATPPATPQYHQPRHVRNQPSRLGGASTLSKVTTLTYESGTSVAGSGGNGASGEKKVKKKRSAFGWLKKAFALDEDEKAAFEARRGAAERNLYYEERSRAFLDGRRVREGQQVRMGEGGRASARSRAESRQVR